MKLKDLPPDDDGPDVDDDEVLDAEAYDVEEFLDDLEEMIEFPHVQYARSTLEGIHETVSKTRRVTDSQKKTIDNIDEGGRRHRRH